MSIEENTEKNFYSFVVKKKKKKRKEKIFRT